MDKAALLFVGAGNGRDDAPGHMDSPGAQHSTTAEIAAQQLLKIVAHFGPPPLLY
jgi:hypothetical protein